MQWTQRPGQRAAWRESRHPPRGERPRLPDPDRARALSLDCTIPKATPKAGLLVLAICQQLCRGGSLGLPELEVAASAPPSRPPALGEETPACWAGHATPARSCPPTQGCPAQRPQDRSGWVLTRCSHRPPQVSPEEHVSSLLTPRRDFTRPGATAPALSSSPSLSPASTHHPAPGRPAGTCCAVSQVREPKPEAGSVSQLGTEARPDPRAPTLQSTAPSPHPRQEPPSNMGEECCQIASPSPASCSTMACPRPGL